MYDFYYNVIKIEFQGNVMILYIYTDSFILKIVCSDFYEFMRKNPDYFDTSDYPKDHIL